jgi:hypothetical protein
MAVLAAIPQMVEAGRAAMDDPKRPVVRNEP